MNRRDFLKLAAMFGIAPSFVACTNKQHIPIPVLMYHDINTDPDDEYSVSPKLFREQMQWLVDNGYNAIPLHEIHNAGPKDFVITFDDGYYSFIDHAQDLLNKHKFHATINVVGRWMSSAQPYIYDIKPRRAMHYGHLKDLIKTGLVEIGCHTSNLHNFKKGVLQCNEEELRADFRVFQNNMFVHLGKDLDIMAWPYGRYNELAVKVAKEEGFKYFLTSHYGKYSGNDDRIERLAITKQRNIRKLING